MTRGIPCGVAIAAMLLPAGICRAADTPEVAERKRQLIHAYNVSHTTGVCTVFTALRQWQKAGWPEGDAAVSEFLTDRVLLRFAPNPEAFQDKSPAELETEFGKFCARSAAQTAQVVDGLAQAPATEAAAANRFRDTLLAATFLGQCQTASALYLQGVPAHKERLERFVIAEVYSRDPKYRHDAVKAQENSAKATLYWKDCDTAEAGFKSIFEQLKPAP